MRLTPITQDDNNAFIFTLQQNVLSVSYLRATNIMPGTLEELCCSSHGVSLFAIVVYHKFVPAKKSIEIYHQKFWWFRKTKAVSLVKYIILKTTDSLKAQIILLLTVKAAISQRKDVALFINPSTTS